MTYNIIATGSTGNAVLINGSILIDCGVSWKKLEPYARQIRLVLLTHEHGDHFKASTVRALHRERPSVRFVCCDWMVKPLVEAGVSKMAIDVAPLVGSTIVYKSLDLSAIPVSVPHNVKNCAWMICIGKEWLFYATDCATLDGIEAHGCDLYMIEGNHTKEEIAKRIAAKDAAGKYAYEREAARNHLSREQAMDWLAQNMGWNSKYVLLHQHQD
jgi:L-ascorbate metabolism protein UlaG (beta-lactamase superfamily)